MHFWYFKVYIWVLMSSVWEFLRLIFVVESVIFFLILSYTSSTDASYPNQWRISELTTPALAA